MKVYLDNAATTQVSPEVLAAMKPFFSIKYGNASEPHSWGQAARAAVDGAREKIAKVLGANAGEIIFTSCATESINLAHRGLIEPAFAKASAGKTGERGGSGIKNSLSPFTFHLSPLHIITTQIEHKAVIETCKHLEKLGWAEVTYLPVDKDGLISIKDVEAAIRPETVLVSIMMVNNEVGTVQSIVEIGKLIRQINVSRVACHLSPIYFHTDATQAVAYFDCDVNKLGVDLLSLTGHKIHAPKGVGLLYVRKGTPLARQQDGGGQEGGLRAGTENVPYIVGLGTAMENVWAKRNKEQETRDREQETGNELSAACRLSPVTCHLSHLRDKLIAGVLKIPGARLTGHSTKRAPHIASFVIEGAEGEAMLLMLSDKGIAASSGSACTSGALTPSHVLLAMGIKPELAHGSLRFSLSGYTTEKEIDYVLSVLPGIVQKLRKMNPLYGNH